MAITDIIFIFLFLPISLLLYYFSDGRWRKYVLLAVSLLFYACGSPEYFLLLLISIMVNTALGWLIGKSAEKKMLAMILLITGILYNTSILFFYKYFDFLALNVSRLSGIEFTARNLLLPMGISFFTFKSISYLVDLYQKKSEANNNPVYAAVYLSFFAQIQSGPLSRYNDVCNLIGGGEET